MFSLQLMCTFYYLSGQCGKAENTAGIWIKGFPLGPLCVSESREQALTQDPGRQADLGCPRQSVPSEAA